MLNKILVELIGSFFFISIILNTLTDTSLGAIAPITVAVGLLAAIYFGGKISGGHFNPAVSFSMFLKKQIPIETLLGYVFFQMLGGILAVLFSDFVLLKK